MKVKIKMKEGFKDLRPSYASKGAAAFDCYAAIPSPKRASIGITHIPLGFSIEIPEGYAGFLFGRSGVGSKGISPSNCVGVIDSDFRAEVCVNLRNSGDYSSDYLIRRGDRLVQMVIQKVERVELEISEELSETERGEGGFGSTGK